MVPRRRSTRALTPDLRGDADLLTRMIPSLVLLLSILIPLGFAVLSVLGYRWWIGRDKRRSPLSGKLHHSAGEQLRARMRDHSDDMMGGWMLMLMSGPLFMLAWALQFVPWRHVEFRKANEKQTGSECLFRIRSGSIAAHRAERSNRQLNTILC